MSAHAFLTGTRDLAAAVDILERTDARLYRHLAEAMTGSFAGEGEKALRSSIRKLGKWRGEAMRESHLAKRLPINVETLMKNWDHGSTYLLRDDWASEGYFSPYDVRVDAKFCPKAEIWEEAGLYTWGLAWCDEIHQSITSAYHPDATVVIPENFMRRDPYCKFHWSMPATPARGTGVEAQPESPGVSSQDSSDRESEGRDALNRMIRLIGGMYAFMATELLVRFGQQGEKGLRECIRRYGEERGRLMREAHRSAGLPVTIETLATDYDLPLEQAWKFKVEKSTPERYETRVTECPFASLWTKLEMVDAGSIYCEEIHQSVIRSYRPDSVVQVDRSLLQGEGRCAITVEVPG